MVVEPSSTFPIMLTLETGAADRYPQAWIYNSAGVSVSGPLNLTAVSGQAGQYFVSATSPATEGGYVILFKVFTDSGHTTLSDTDGPTSMDLSVVPVAEIPGLVWDEAVADHLTLGSFGDVVQVAAAIAGKSNYRIDEVVYNANQFMTSARIRIFPDAATAAASTVGGTSEGETHTIELTGSPDGTYVARPASVLGVRA